MSTIFGIFDRKGTAIPELATGAMQANLGYWKSDYTKVEDLGELVLGHIGLRVTPESASEHQPLRSLDGSCWITADVRLDNRADLAESLGVSVPSLAGLSDSELMLLAYLKWGERCAERFVGDFAFAIWDSRKRKLFLGRDPVGIRPLFYFESSELFVFASELRGVVAHPSVPRLENRAWMVEYLASIHLAETREQTFFQGVRLLSRAHSLSVSQGAIVQLEYWALNPGVESRFGSFEEFKEGFRERFGEAVKCRLRSDSPVASELSSGIDCTSILTTALRVGGLGSGVSLFTHGVSPASQIAGKEILEEYELASRFCRELGFPEPRRICEAEGGIRGLIEKALSQKGSPQMELWSLFSQPLYDAVKEDSGGARVLLSGAGGNNLVSDPASLVYLDFLRQGRFSLFYRELGFEAELKRWGRWRTLRRGVSCVCRASGLTRRLLGRSGGFFEALNPNIQAEYMVDDMREELARRVAFRSHSEKLVFQTTGFYLDRGRFPESSALAQSAGFEVRYPMMDVRLLEYCLAAPVEYARRLGWGRFMLRGTIDELPEFIRWRDDNRASGIPWPQSRLFYERESLVEALRLSGRSRRVTELIDVAALEKALLGMTTDEPFMPLKWRMPVNLGLVAALSLGSQKMRF